MTLTTDELREVLRLHCMWLRGEPGGSRAILAGADLADAILAGVAMIEARLS